MDSKPSTAPFIDTSIGLGVMSGTSCDGLDLALCQFSGSGSFKILAFDGISYGAAFRQKLQAVMQMSGLELLLFENEFTALVADAIVTFLRKAPRLPGFIAAHGHTVFHQLEAGLTYQMLNGALLAARCQIPVVCDFRRQDVALGGQGAPLVPIGDRLLFSQYDACLNLGGIANASFPKAEPYLAYDIGPANLLLNALASRAGSDYDANGDMARSAEPDQNLLEKLNSIAYYLQAPPKSLGKEWVDSVVMPHFEDSGLTTFVLLATAVEHIAMQVAYAFSGMDSGSNILVTGGGAFNSFLVQRMSYHCDCVLHVPDRLLVEAKEALIFALLGKLRLDGNPNTIASVTGASRPCPAGAVYTC